MTAEGTEQAKAALLSALAELKRAPSPGAKRAVLSATSQLEASDDALSASADGRWALLFSCVSYFGVALEYVFRTACHQNS